jgi:hypothetical protein
MHPNHQAPEMSYEPGEITASNTLLDTLSATLLPAAERAFSAAILRQSATSGADALAGEALSALRGILTELHDAASLDAEMRRLAAGLADALATPSDEPASWEQADMRVWLQARAMDLARAVATFWANLGDSTSARHAACTALLPTLARRERGTGGVRQQWDLICSRFFLSPQQGGLLLEMADQQARQRNMRKPRTVPATPAGVLTTGTLHLTHS